MVTAPDTVVPPAGDVTVTLGAVPSTTVTITWAVAMLPAASRATARSTWGPGAALAAFQVAEYGAVVSSEPRLTPSTWNWTPATPRASVACAVTVTEPDTTAPLAGEAMDTVGGIVSAGRMPALTRSSASVNRGMLGPPAAARWSRK